jgi:hypothetical protein
MGKEISASDQKVGSIILGRSAETLRDQKSKYETSGLAIPLPSHSRFLLLATLRQ